MKLSAKLFFLYCFLLCLSSASIRAATSYYWDLNGATAGSGSATPNGSWEGANWSTSAGGTAATANWVDGGFPRFAAGSDATGTYTVTANANHLIAGAFLTSGNGTVTINGTGILSIDTAGGGGVGGIQQGFFGQSSAFLKFSSKLSGAGGIVSQQGQIFLDGNNDYAGGTSIGSGLINFNNNNSFGTGLITVSVNSSALIAEVGGITVPNNFNVAGNFGLNLSAIPATITTTYNGTWTLGANTISLGVGGGAGNTAVVAGVISGTGGVGRQAQNPAGTLTLSGANTYLGKSSIQSGITSVSSLNSVTTPAQQASSNLGTPSSAANGTISIGSTTMTGTLLYTGPGETTDRIIDLAGTSGGATLDQSGTGPLKFTSSLTTSVRGSKTLTLQGSTAGSGEISGVIANGVSGTTALSANFSIGATSITLGSVDGVSVGASISGTGLAAGTTVSTINTGTKVVGLSTAATGAGTAGQTMTVAGVVNLTSVTKSGTGTWTLSGANTYSGTTTLNTAGQLNLTRASSLGTSTFVINQNGLFDNTSGADLTIANTFTLSGGSPTYVGSANNMTINGPVTISGANRTITVTARTLTLASIVNQDSTRSFTKNGAGTLVLKGGTAYTGNTTVNGGGTLAIGGSGQMTAGSYSGNITLTSGIFDHASSASQTLSGIISSAGSLSKTGSGTLTLTAPNTYGGGTTVSDGTLAVNNSTGSGTGAGAVAVQTGGTLGGNGTISGVVTVSSGGTIAPGNSIGTLSLGSSPSLAGSMLMEINTSASPNADKLAVAAPLAFGGTLTINNIGAAPTGGEVFALFDATGFSGSFDTFNLPTLSAGLNWYTGNLVVDGTVIVNRAPLAQDAAYSRAKGTSLKILKSDLLIGASDPDAGDSASYDTLVGSGTQGATVTEDASYVYYDPANDNNDTLQFRVKDSRDGTVTKNISITVTSATGQAQTITVSGSSATVTFLGIPGFGYVIQRSTNLVDWSSLSSTTAPPAGVFDYADDFSDLGSVPSSAYYRLQQP